MHIAMYFSTCCQDLITNSEVLCTQQDTTGIYTAALRLHNIDVPIYMHAMVALTTTCAASYKLFKLLDMGNY